MKTVKIFLNSANGYGDQYECILAAHSTIKHFRSLGYNIEFYALASHRYFNLNIPMTTFFDFSQYDVGEVKTVQNKDIESLVDGYYLINTDRKYMDIYCEKSNITLLKYEPERFNHNDFIHFGNKKYLNKSFLQKDIIELSNQKFDFLGDDFIICQLRVSDMLLEKSFDEILTDQAYNAPSMINSMMAFVESKKDKKIFFTSCNYNIAKYFKERYDNIYQNVYKHQDLRLHNVYDLYNTTDELDKKYIEHSKEILAEMHVFSKAIGMYCLAQWRSNYLLYGMVHNIHHKNSELQGTSLIL